jgi:hypothetical protein
MARVKLAWTLVVFLIVASVAEAATVRNLVASARDAAAAANLDQLNAEAARLLTMATTTLEDSEVLDEDLTEFATRYTYLDAVGLAHRRTARYRPDVAEAIRTIKQVKVFLENRKLAPIEFVARVTELQLAEQKARLAWDMESLRRLERKYGPGSAKLNALEVGAAYLLQRTSAFGINDQGRPGPFEAVIAYVPAYLSQSEGKVRLIGVAETGLRQYIFKNGWGSVSGRLAFLKPAYLSYGLAWSSQSDDPMQRPWHGASRSGVFFGWGSLKVAVLRGDGTRFLITQQFQLVPWVF